VEKLRKFFTKRGVVLSGAAISAAISATQFRPHRQAYLGITAAASLAGTTLSTPQRTQDYRHDYTAKTLVVATVTILIGAGAYEALLISRLRDQNQSSASSRNHLPDKSNNYNAKKTKPRTGWPN